jgi:peptidoglycan hydrolase CwlO-like protein
MWDGCLNIDKVCRLKDIHGIEPQDRMQVHSWLVNKSSSRNRRLDETSSADTTKQLERQATQLDKITIMLHSIQKDMKSTKGESKLINQLQSQIKQLRTQISQIQKNIAKRNFTTATISSRKKMLRHNKRQ